MKRITAIILTVAVAALAFCACGTGNTTDKNLKEVYIGVSEGVFPQSEVLYGLETRLPEHGYKLIYREYKNAKEANDALVNGEIDFSCITQKYELEAYGSDALVNLGAVYYCPYAIYLISYEKTESIKKGSVIAVPDDAQGMARALMLLDEEGFIGLRDGTGLNATLDDIEDNENNYIVEAVPADSFADAEVDIIVVDTECAVQLGYEILIDSVAYEKIDSLAAQQYSTVVLVNSADMASDEIKTVQKFLFTRRMYDAIDDCTDSIVFPSFEVQK